MEDLDFVVDTTASEDNELLKTFISPFPTFTSSKFTLGTDSEAEDDEPEDDDDEYFGKFVVSINMHFLTFPNFLQFSGLPPSSIRIKDALEKCPFKVECFKKDTSTDGSNTEKKFNDQLLNAFDDYLGELRPKKYSFVTDGIEAKKDISYLGMSDNQLRKTNRVSRLLKVQLNEQFKSLQYDDSLQRF